MQLLYYSYVYTCMAIDLAKLANIASYIVSWFNECNLAIILMC